MSTYKITAPAQALIELGKIQHAISLATNELIQIWHKLPEGSSPIACSLLEERIEKLEKEYKAKLLIVNSL